VTVPAGRLSLRALGALTGRVRPPAYDCASAGVGIVHLGVGNFHRAHQAVYADDALGGRQAGWGVVGVSLRNAAMRDALAPQDGLYTLIERDAADPGGRARVIGALRGLLVAPESPTAVVARLSDPGTRIVTMTITEKGYCRGADGTLDLRAPEVAHDLLDPALPRSAIGLLHAAARARERNGGRGFTVLSCDNLSSNGRITRELLLQFDAALAPAARASPRPLQAWIEREMAFPDSMVDRIVPHTTDEHRALARELLGVADAWPVVTEPFVQWVLQDRFAAGRPRWEDCGVQFVDDVAAFEQMKLRLLNAAHSSIAYLGVPAGLETVDRAIARPELRVFVGRLWRDEVAPTLPAVVQPALEAYCARLIERFANPALGHRTAQIAMDGSQKLPLRLLPTLRRRLADAQPFDRLAMGLAAWIRYLGGRTESGEACAVDDPLAPQLAAALAGARGDPAAMVRGVLAVRAVFGHDLAADPRVGRAVERQLRRLLESGTLAALAQLEQECGAPSRAAHG
jgi:fructuronate reductase